jgi:hypothetical protein
MDMARGGCSRIAGPHADDQAAMIHRLQRGTGFRGCAGYADPSMTMDCC